MPRLPMGDGRSPTRNSNRAHGARASRQHAMTPERLHRIWRRCAECQSGDIEVAAASDSVRAGH